jgi:hypothetical protein
LALASRSREKEMKKAERRFLPPLGLSGVIEHLLESTATKT